MERAKLVLNIPYRDMLNNDERERYPAKIADIGLEQRFSNSGSRPKVGSRAGDSGVAQLQLGKKKGGG